MSTEALSRSPTLAEFVRIAVESHIRDIWTGLPGKIVKYDPDKQMADVKPLVQDLTATEDGGELVEPLPVVPNVPVRFPRAGGFYITLPVEEGDFCILMFCARSIDKYLEGSGNDTNPEDFRTHDLTDAYALMGGGPFSHALKEDGIDKNLVLGKEGGVSVHIKGDGTIHLGSKDASDALALASKVKADNQTLYNAISGAVVVAMDGGASLKSTILAALAGYPSDVGSDVVKSE